MYAKNRTKQCSYAIKDIFDGHLYRKNNFDDLPDDIITLNFSVDGTPLFKASQTSITPVLCTVNEINPKIRKNHIILTSTDIPDMDEYLKPFKYNNVEYHKKCQILIGICDSVERPKLRGSKSFRGEYGCGFCKHKGEEIAKGRGYVRIFPIDDDGNAHGEGLRSHTETLIHANNVEKGIKHRSVLCDIPKFDIIKNLTPDWMHCVALGVCRQFLKLWIDSSYHEREFYLGNHISATDKLLLSFKPSMDVSRTPRTMSKDRLHLKAHELLTYLEIMFTEQVCHTLEFIS
ncbi:Protein of unknown function [Cotesia congregata]|uniref:Uncharacterized protein n=1 Tax=Cotesia congregata TaxID=51543 RepID=A0A8J2MSQ6_COTCN|nr:Protein of unknown function [Cotesia congregata]